MKSIENTNIAINIESDKIKVNDLYNYQKIKKIYYDYKYVIFYPNGKKEHKNTEVEDIFNFSKEIHDNLLYQIHTKINHKNKIINVYIIPIVEGA